MDGASYDLFVSYAEVERDWVDQYVVGPLRAAGFVCHSQEAFLLGVPRVLEFERAVKHSRRTLLVLSPAYLSDGSGQLVDQLANTYGTLTATWPVIPLLLQPVELPQHLAMLQCLDATQPGDWEQLSTRLAEQLRVTSPQSRPKGASVEQARSATSGLFALVALMHEADVRDAVVAFRADFSAACEQVHVLGDQKRRHDDFQVLETAYWLVYHAARREMSDEEDWSQVSELQDTAEAVLSHVTQVEQAPVWVQKLDRARLGLQQAMHDHDPDALGPALASINSVLSSEPSRTNARLVTAARALRLVNLVQALTTIRDRVARQRLDSGGARHLETFGRGVDELAAVNEALADAVSRHDSFQAIDDELRRVESQPAGDMGELKQAWLDVKPLVGVVSVGAHPDWVRGLNAVGTNLEDALTGADPVKARNYFRSYRSKTNRRFNQVDHELLELCEELEKIGDPLIGVLGLIHDN